MLIDTHCHLDFPDFDRDRDQVFLNAADAGVKALINVGASFESSRISVQLASTSNNVFATVGIHPHEAKSYTSDLKVKLRKMIDDNKRIVAIGEVGLDYFRNLSPANVQEEIFEIFMELAVEVRLPLVIHSRGAHGRTLELLKANARVKDCGVVFHCFSGELKELKECLDLGFYVSFTGNITYPKSIHAKEVVRFMPLERMFLETDAPFLAPGNRRGERNAPAYLVEIAEEIAMIKGEPFEKICSQTTANAIKFFKLPIACE
jgi:TatD DNase family protein